MTMMAYVGVSPCGCIRAAVADRPEHAKAVSKDVASFIANGDIVERMSGDQVRVKFCFDKHQQPRGKPTVCPHPGACPHRTKEPA